MNLAARLFTWLHRADFYSAFHYEAVKLLPEGDGQPWFDIGCGPGVLSRAAATRGYQVTGFDIDRDMIKAASMLSVNTGFNTPKYEQFDIFKTNSPHLRAKVASASSLLPVIKNKEDALRRLYSLVEVGGFLVIIETNSKCNILSAIQLFIKHPRISNFGVILLGLVRRGRTAALDATHAYFKDNEMQSHTLSNGIIDVVMVKKQVPSYETSTTATENEE